MKSVHVVVKVTSFTNKCQTLQGGTFYIINYRLTCKQSYFINCTSEGVGGAIYIKNSKELSNDIKLDTLAFFNCSALYGCAIYIYSSYNQNNVTIHECKFYSNEVDLQDSVNDNGLKVPSLLVEMS